MRSEQADDSGSAWPHLLRCTAGSRRWQQDEKQTQDGRKRSCTSLTAKSLLVWSSDAGVGSLTAAVQQQKVLKKLGRRKTTASKVFAVNTTRGLEMEAKNI